MKDAPVLSATTNQHPQECQLMELNQMMQADQPCILHHSATITEVIETKKLKICSYYHI